MSFAEQIAAMLESMQDLVFVKGDSDIIEISKEDFKFAQIKQDKLYFIESDGDMQLFDRPNISNQDSTLHAATQAFWKAKKMKKSLL